MKWRVKIKLMPNVTSCSRCVPKTQMCRLPAENETDEMHVVRDVFSSCYRKKYNASNIDDTFTKCLCCGGDMPWNWRFRTCQAPTLRPPSRLATVMSKRKDILRINIQVFIRRDVSPFDPKTHAKWPWFGQDTRKTDRVRRTRLTCTSEYCRIPCACLIRP